MISLINWRFGRRCFLLSALLILSCIESECRSSDSQLSPTRAGLAETSEISISRITPDKRGGQAYQLVYRIQAPLEVYWRFKTDFDNDFVVKNKYIKEHRVISRTHDWVITENQYEGSPGVYFKWQTLVDKKQHRLDFKLLNPEQCRQKFHYGYIQLEVVSGGTNVIQVAYFDFTGASLWSMYPWRGGMKDFLTYTVQWERNIFFQLQDYYLQDLE